MDDRKILATNPRLKRAEGLRVPLGGIQIYVRDSALRAPPHSLTFGTNPSRQTWLETPGSTCLLC